MSRVARRYFPEPQRLIRPPNETDRACRASRRRATVSTVTRVENWLLSFLRPSIRQSASASFRLLAVSASHSVDSGGPNAAGRARWPSFTRETDLTTTIERIDEQEQTLTELVNPSRGRGFDWRWELCLLVTNDKSR